MILSQVPGALIPIFVLPPSYQEWMRRWESRGVISSSERHNRMQSARRELTEALHKKYYHFLVNDDLVKSVNGVKKIVSGVIDTDHEVQGERIARQILQQLETDLASPQN